MIGFIATGLRCGPPFAEQLSEFHGILSATLGIALTTKLVRKPILGAILGATPRIGRKPKYQPKLSERLLKIDEVPVRQTI